MAVRSFRFFPSFTGRKMFCASPNYFVPDQKVIYILCHSQTWFSFSKIVFCASTKVFEEALNAVKFLGRLKKFGPAQNILWPVKGQGINAIKLLVLVKKFGQSQKFLEPVKDKAIVHISYRLGDFVKISWPFLENLNCKRKSPVLKHVEWLGCMAFADYIQNGLQDIFIFFTNYLRWKILV